MKLINILLLSTALTWGLASCSKSDTAQTHEGETTEHSDDDGHDHAAAKDPHAGHNHGPKVEYDEEDLIVLEPDAAKGLGVETSKAARAPFGSVVKVSGRVMPSGESAATVSSPSAGIVTLAPGISLGSKVSAGQRIATVKSDGVSGGDVNRAARVELQAARAEFDRVSALYADRLVTLAQYNAAKAALDRAKAQFSGRAASGSITSPISGVITALDIANGQYVEVGGPVAAVASDARLTMRADVPFKKYRAVADASDARIVVPATGVTLLASSLDGRRSDGGASTSGASGGYVPVTFSLRNDGSLIPGSAVEVYLMGNDRREALTVPVGAVGEQEGTYFVFVKVSEHGYVRVPVTVGVSDGSNVEILSGLKGGENVVSKGATAVKLASMSGAVPEGHSHSH